jgi:hypothetical protein
MTETDREPFAQLLADVMAFYRRDASAFALEAWWQACRRYPLEAVRAAFTAHARDPERGAFAPMPADVIRQLDGTAGDRALVAWHRVLAAMHSVGHYSSVDFGDAFAHAAITDLGGWPALCCARTDELDFARRRFCESYRAYLAAGAVPPDTPRRLAGEHEARNEALGFTVASEGRWESLAAPDDVGTLRQAVARLS